MHASYKYYFYANCSNNITIPYPVINTPSFVLRSASSTLPMDYSYTLPKLDMPSQCDRRLEHLTTPHTSCRLATATLIHVPLEGESVRPAGITAFAAHVLEVEVGRPDVLGDVLNMHAVAGREVKGAARARAGADAAGPPTDDATRAMWSGVFVGGVEMLAEGDLVDGDFFVAVVDQAAHDGRRLDVRSRFRRQ
jgi:hypothetical protein